MTSNIETNEYRIYTKEHKGNIVFWAPNDNVPTKGNVEDDPSYCLAFKSVARGDRDSGATETDEVCPPGIEPGTTLLP